MKFTQQAVACVVALAAFTDARPSLSTHALHEKRDGAMRTWIKRDRVASDAILPIKIGLKQENLHRGYDHLMDVSDPTSANYAKHWTADDVAKAFAPSEDTLTAIRAWLHEAGIAAERVKQSTNKGWLSFHATAREAEDLLHTEFYDHEHTSNGKWAVGCDEYHVPKKIQQHIDYVTPGVKTTQLKKRSLSKSKRGSKPPGGWGPPTGPWKKPHPPPFPGHHPETNLTGCDTVVTPACIAALYQIPEPNHSANPGNAIGIFEQGDTYAQEDLDLFFANFTSYIPQGTHPKLDSIDGAVAPVATEDAGGESDLDFQLAYPIVYPIEVVLYQVDDPPYADGLLPNSGFGNTFLDALDGSYCTYTAFGETGNDPALDPIYPDPSNLTGAYKGQLMCGTYKPTPVITISYGEQEIDLPPNYQERQCNEFMKLGLQGVSIFVASGDTGVAGTRGSDGNRNGCIGPNANVFNPTNPNSCPYVTNVGATTIAPNHTVYSPETAAWELFGHGNNTSLFTSSGGFSNIYPIPAYQASAVARYFEIAKPTYPYYEMLGGFNASKAGNGIYNRIGHGIPDVAALGQNIALFNEGEFVLEGGTSASSPIFASVVTRINDARLNVGKKPIGFVNPVLYAHPYVLNDITNGTNPGCGTNGFSASVGWDPVTGLGTPNYPKMLELFLSLP